jgi:hypothetical protein
MQGIDEYFVLKEAEGEIRCKIPSKKCKVIPVLNQLRITP